MFQFGPNVLDPRLIFDQNFQQNQAQLCITHGMNKGSFGMS